MSSIVSFLLLLAVGASPALASRSVDSQPEPLPEPSSGANPPRAQRRTKVGFADGTERTVHVRESPSLNAPIVETLARGDAVNRAGR